jgi:hypothetical protein
MFELKYLRMYWHTTTHPQNNAVLISDKIMVFPPVSPGVGVKLHALLCWTLAFVTRAVLDAELCWTWWRKQKSYFPYQECKPCASRHSRSHQEAITDSFILNVNRNHVYVRNSGVFLRTSFIWFTLELCKTNINKLNNKYYHWNVAIYRWIETSLVWNPSRFNLFLSLYL